MLFYYKKQERGKEIGRVISFSASWSLLIDDEGFS
jgi:hypothetical protein